MKKRKYFLNQLHETEQDHLKLINVYKRFQGFLAEANREESVVEINANIKKITTIRNHIHDFRLKLIEKQEKFLAKKK